MAIERRATIVGLTAPFGSGATTAAQILKDRLAFTSFGLSQLIRDDLAKKGPDMSPTRTDLQTHGDELRRSTHTGVLAELAVRKLDEDPTAHGRIVIDGIRNLAEIDFLRQEFGNRFSLFAIECPQSHRWERLRPKYEQRGLSMREFLTEDRRDHGEEVEYGQQVQLCVDQADLLIDNSDDVSLADLRTKLVDYAELMIGSKYRFASPLEIYMNVAYSASHGSKCLKRQVGAVLVDAAPNIRGEVVGQGFNENPLGTKPCIEEPEYGARPEEKIPGKCYRDIIRQEGFVQLSESGIRCPQCGGKITLRIPNGPPWECKACGADLEYYFWPERAMTLCTAVHAEVAAILAANGRAKNATLYTTTFPCLGGHPKTGQLWSPENRPVKASQDKS